MIAADEVAQGAQTLYDAAVVAYKADSTDAAKITAVSTAETALSGANAALTSAQTAAASGDATAALTFASTAVTAAAAAGYTEDTDVTALRTSASALNTSAQSAEAESSETTSANTATEAAFKDAAGVPNMALNFGTVKFNLKTGALYFNGKPMNDTLNLEMAEKCREVLKRGR